MYIYNIMVDYKKQYLKYKLKYMNFKNKLRGGDDNPTEGDGEQQLRLARGGREGSKVKFWQPEYEEPDEEPDEETNEEPDEETDEEPDEEPSGMTWYHGVAAVGSYWWRIGTPCPTCWRQPKK